MPLGHLLHDLVHEIIHVDHHVFSTFWQLLRRPGLLTVDYLEGRRVRHLPPVRLYLITSFILFLGLGFMASRLSTFQKGAKGLVVGTSVSPETKRAVDTEMAKHGVQVDPRVLQAAGAEAKGGTSNFDAKLNQGAQKIAKDPSVLLTKFFELLPKVMFVLLPIFALVLKLLYVRRNILYAAHFIFSLHVHTAAFLLFLAGMGLGYLPGLGGWNVLILAVVQPVFLALAMRRTYGQSWPKTLVKGALLSAIYLPLLTLSTVGTIVWAVYKAA